MYKTLLISIFLFIGFNTLSQTNVLSKGTWLKLGITQTGIYKLDKAYMQQLGFDTNTLIPQNIQLYGNQAGMLPQANATARLTGLVQLPIVVIGEQDGKWDTNDYVLFYAQSPHQILYNATSQSFTHQINYYSDTTFYYLTVGETPGLRLSSNTTVTSNNSITTFDDYQFHEIDRRNILAQAPFAGSGREWYGEEFIGNSSQVFSFNTTGLVSNTPVVVTSSVLNTSFGTTAFNVSLNGQPLGTQTLDAVINDRYEYKGKASTQVFRLNSNALGNVSNLDLTLAFDRKGLSSGGALLNYVGIQTQRQLGIYGGQTHFCSMQSLQNPDAKFVFTQLPTNAFIWDVSNPLMPAIQPINNNAIGVATSSLKRFIVCDNQTFLSPVSFQKIANQQVSTLSVPTMLIVCGEMLRPIAQQLADFRLKNDNIVATVVSTESIYHEFSAGKPDPTAIRDFVKFMYDKTPNTLKYLLLFGDASYDYKKRLQVVGSETQALYIPTYESRESLHPIFSYASDDYYGFLEKNEGEWPESDLGNHSLDIGIGRLPVKTKAEAQQLVDKLMAYANQSDNSDWRSKVTFVADNGDANLHQSDAEFFANMLNNTAFQTEKIYLDNYPLVSLPEGQRSPTAKTVLNNQIEQGSLIVNYNGHGAEAGWTDEQILTVSDINAWTNYRRLPLMLTATCQFGRFDDPNQISGAELALLSEKGGAVALFSTTRPVFQNTNYLLNFAFYEAVFKALPNGQMPRLGDIFKETKNKSLAGVVNRNFTLLGDPSMQLLYPSQQISFAPIDTLKALRKVALQGQILNAAATAVDATFQGEALVTVYDKPQTLQTLGNKGDVFPYSAYANVLFRGKLPVKNGQISGSFVVPKDINYQYGVGKITAFAYNSQQRNANGSQAILVGGSQKISQPDNTPPVLAVYMDEKVEKEYYITNTNANVLIDLYDESGINLATQGLGHDITLNLDDTMTVRLNPYFTSLLGDFTKGSIAYPLQNLSVGKHIVKIKAWDTYNNSVEKALNFEVIVQPNQTLSNTKAYPNPFHHTVHFSFEHNRVGDNVLVELELYDSWGQRLQHFTQTVYNISSPCEAIAWDLSDTFNQRAKGIYFYRISMKSLTINYEASSYGKLIHID